MSKKDSDGIYARERCSTGRKTRKNAKSRYKKWKRRLTDNKQTTRSRMRNEVGRRGE